MATTKSSSMLVVVVAMAVVLLVGTRTKVSLVAMAAPGVTTLDAKSPRKLACHGDGCHSQTTVHLSKQELGKSANLDTTGHLPPFVSAYVHAAKIMFSLQKSTLSHSVCSSFIEKKTCGHF
jgi:hypothetical protein